MKLKMSEKSVFAVLLRSPWWISIGLVVAIALASKAMLPEAHVAVGVMGGFPFLVIGIVAAWRQWHAPNPAHVARVMVQAAGMNWCEFSAAIEQSYAGQGFVVTRLQGVPADFKLERAGRTTLVSCKRWKAATQGVEVLRELVAFRLAQDASHCTCISLAEPTGNARNFARENTVQLVFGNDLARLISNKNRNQPR